MICAICKHAVADTGLLCDDCSDELASAEIAPEQIEDYIETPVAAGLIDQWGRPHRIEASTTVGRNVNAHGIAIFESSVSRLHARIERVGDAWIVRDLASANGTFIDSRQVQGSATIQDGERIRFGEISFHFLVDVASLPPPRFTSLIGKTVSSPDPRALTEPTLPLSRGDLAMRTLAMRLHEPTGGGGGVVEIDGKQVQLTTPQFELVSLLVARMTQESGLAEDARGFVKPTELMMKLSWDSQEPNDDHVRQLVRRVRRLLRKADLDELIESRPRTGYRLRVIPA